MSGLSHPQGDLRTRYQIVPRVLIFISHTEHILLLKGSPQKKLWANLYNGIGGHIEKGESPKQAALRELQEETGLDNVQLRLCGVIIIDADNTAGVGLYVFKGKSRTMATRSSQEGKLEWIPKSEVLKMPLVEDLYHLLPKVLAMRPDEPPFSALYSYARDGKLEIAFDE